MNRLLCVIGVLAAAATGLSALAADVAPGGTASAQRVAARAPDQQTEAVGEEEFSLEEEDVAPAGVGAVRRDVPPAGVPGLTAGGGPTPNEPGPRRYVVLERPRRRVTIRPSVSLGLAYGGRHSRWGYSGWMGTSPGCWWSWPYYRPVGMDRGGDWYVGFSGWYPIHRGKHSRLSLGLGLGTSGRW